MEWSGELSSASHGCTATTLVQTSWKSLLTGLHVSLLPTLLSHQDLFSTLQQEWSHQNLKQSSLFSKPFNSPEIKVLHHLCHNAFCPTISLHFPSHHWPFSHTDLSVLSTEWVLFCYMASAHTILFTWNPLAPTLFIKMVLTSLGLSWNVISPTYLSLFLSAPLVLPLTQQVLCLFCSLCIHSAWHTADTQIHLLNEDVKNYFLLQGPNCKHHFRFISQSSLPLPISSSHCWLPWLSSTTMKPAG